MQADLNGFDAENCRPVEIRLRPQMVPLLWIVVCLVSLAVALMCGLAAVTILAAIVTGKFIDPEAWKAVVFLAAVACLLLFLCRAAWRLSE